MIILLIYLFLLPAELIRVRDCMNVFLTQYQTHYYYDPQLLAQ